MTDPVSDPADPCDVLEPEYDERDWNFTPALGDEDHPEPRFWE